MLSLTTLLFIAVPLQQAPVAPQEPAVLAQLRALGYVAAPATPAAPAFPQRLQKLTDTGTMGVQIGNERETLNGNTTESVVILGILPGSAASVAGLQADDRIISINGKSVETVDSLTAALKGQNPGAEVKVVVKRGNVSKTLVFPLGGAQGQPLPVKRLRLELDENGLHGQAGQKGLVRLRGLKGGEDELKFFVHPGSKTDHTEHTVRWHSSATAEDGQVHGFFSGPDGETHDFSFELEGLEGLQQLHELHGGNLLEDLGEFGIELEELLHEVVEEDGDELMGVLGHLFSEGSEAGEEFALFFDDFQEDAEDWASQFEDHFEGFAEHFSDRAEHMEDRFEERMERFAERMEHRAEALEHRMERMQERRAEAREGHEGQIQIYRGLAERRHAEAQEHLREARRHAGQVQAQASSTEKSMVLRAELEELRAENKALHSKVDTLTDQVAALVSLLEAQQQSQSGAQADGEL